jgi:hypothetical protein
LSASIQKIRIDLVRAVWGAREGAVEANVFRAPNLAGALNFSWAKSSAAQLATERKIAV